MFFSPGTNWEGERERERETGEKQQKTKVGSPWDTKDKQEAGGECTSRYKMQCAEFQHDFLAVLSKQDVSEFHFDSSNLRMLPFTLQFGLQSSVQFDKQRERKHRLKDLKPKFNNSSLFSPQQQPEFTF